jgi:hypothetical protein
MHRMFYHDRSGSSKQKCYWSEDAEKFVYLASQDHIMAVKIVVGLAIQRYGL